MPWTSSSGSRDVHRIGERVRGLVRLRVERRIAEIAFGVGGVVQLPLGHRRDRRAGREHARRLLQQLQGHVAAIGPAHHRDLGWIDERLLLEPFDAGELVLDLGVAHGAIDRIFEPGAATVGAAVVDREHDPALVDQRFVQRQLSHTRRRSPAARADRHRRRRRPDSACPARSLRREHPVVKLRAVRARDAAERRLHMAVEIGRVGMRRVERILLDPGEPLARSRRRDRSADGWPGSSG